MDVLDDLLQPNQSSKRTILLIHQLSSEPTASFDSRDRLALVNGFARIARRAESAWPLEERWQISAALRSTLPMLVGFVADPDPAVRRAVPDAIVTIGTVDEHVVDAIRDRADLETDDLALVRQIWALDALRGYDPERQMAICVTLAEWFVHLLRHRSVDIRLAAIAVLALRGPSDDDAVRLAAAAVVPATAPILSTDSPLWRTSSIRFGYWRSMELLARQLADHPERTARLALAVFRSRDPQIRKWAPAMAGEILMRWRTPMDELWAATAAALTDADPLTRSGPAKLLAAAGNAARPFADALLEAVDTSEEPWREVDAAAALAGIGDPRILPTLQQWISTRPHWPSQNSPLEVLGPFRDQAPELLPAMRARMRPEYAPVLAAWGPVSADAVPELVGLLGTPDAAGACVALGAIGPQAHAAADVLAQLALGTLTPPRHAGAGAAIPWHGTQGAAWAHWRITGNTEIVLAVVGRAVRRGLGHAVLPYLAELGPLAAEYVDAIRPLLDLPGRWSRLESAYAMWRIIGDSAPALPLMMAALEPLRAGRSNALVRTAVRYVGEIGRPAEAALPVLEHVITSERRFADQFSLRTIREDDELLKLAYEARHWIGGHREAASAPV